MENTNNESNTNPDGGTLPLPDKALEYSETINQRKILDELLKQVKKVDFSSLAKLKGGEKLTNKHTQIIVIEKILELAKQNSWSLCTRNGFLYLFNGRYWKAIDQDNTEFFLGSAAELMGVDKYEAMHHGYRKQLVRQFKSQAFLKKPDERNDVVLVNLRNGTFEISPKGSKLRGHDMNDFLRHQLDFDYRPSATAPLFESFLNRVLPDKTCQMVLAEFFGSVFIKTETLKLEKALLLYGSGANGKSVIYELLTFLLGEKNVSSFSLASLMDSTGYYRAMIGDKLLNFASEISGDLEVGLFKQLASGEPVTARMIFSAPIEVRNYAKLAFNTNTLPKNVEHTHAFFRRFLIIPFLVTIPEAEQDKELVKKIINAGELSGIFNWVLEGLRRVMAQKGFTHSDAINAELAKYKSEADNVSLFLEECNYVQDVTESMSVKGLSDEYSAFCKDYRYMALNHGNFVKRLRTLGFVVQKKNKGLIVFIRQENTEGEGEPAKTPTEELKSDGGLDFSSFKSTLKVPKPEAALAKPEPKKPDFSGEAEDLGEFGDEITKRLEGLVNSAAEPNHALEPTGQTEDIDSFATESIKKYTEALGLTAPDADSTNVKTDEGDGK